MAPRLTFLELMAMPENQSNIRRAFIYGLCAALVGGGLWLLTIVMLTPAEEKFIPTFWIAAMIGLAVWFACGFLIGMYSKLDSQPRETGATQLRHRSWLGVVLNFFGWFLYRFVVGFLIANLTCGVLAVSLAGLLIAKFGDLDQFDKAMRRTAVGDTIIFASMGAFYGGLAGAVFGALFASKGGPGTKPHIGRSALWASLLGMILGAKDGALCAAGFTQRERTDDTATALIVVLLVSGVIAGLVSALIAALYSKVTHVEPKPVSEVGPC
jgi:type IV secretory pathway TrbD component